MSKTKTKEKKILKENKGITLIALVITIIVLLILAAVSIATLTGDNGILTKANEAKNTNNEAEEKEQIRLAYDAAMTDNYEKGDFSNGVSKAQLEEKLEKQDSEAQVTADGTDITVTYPSSGNEYIVDGKTGKIEKNTTEKIDREGLEIGDVINYTYNDKEPYHLEGKQSGNGTYDNDNFNLIEAIDQDIEQTKNIVWKVLNIYEDGTVDLISMNNTSEVAFGGVAGYTNGPYFMNDICEKHYSNEQLGTIARSLTDDDIEKNINTEVLNEIHSGYGVEQKVTRYKYYPYTLVEGLSIPWACSSEDNGFRLSSSPLTIKVDSYPIYFSDIKKGVESEKFNELLEERFHSNIWLASRSTYQIYGEIAYWCLNYSNFDYDFRNSKMICNSSGKGFAYSYVLCPIVKLSNKIKLKQESNGSWTPFKT